MADPHDGRVPCDPPLTPVQFKVAALLGSGHTVEDAARALKVSLSTVKFHVRQAADRIPGDLPPRFRLIAWYRKAPLSVLHMQQPLSSASALKEALRIALMQGG